MIPLPANADILTNFVFEDQNFKPCAFPFNVYKTTGSLVFNIDAPIEIHGGTPRKNIVDVFQLLSRNLFGEYPFGIARRSYDPIRDIKDSSKEDGDRWNSIRDEWAGDLVDITMADFASLERKSLYRFSTFQLCALIYYATVFVPHSLQGDSMEINLELPTKNGGRSGKQIPVSRIVNTWGTSIRYGKKDEVKAITILQEACNYILNRGHKGLTTDTGALTKRHINTLDFVTDLGENRLEYERMYKDYENRFAGLPDDHEASLFIPFSHVFFKTRVFLDALEEMRVERINIF